MSDTPKSNHQQPPLSSSSSSPSGTQALGVMIEAEAPTPEKMNVSSESAAQSENTSATGGNFELPSPDDETQSFPSSVESAPEAPVVEAAYDTDLPGPERAEEEPSLPTGEDIAEQSSPETVEARHSGEPEEPMVEASDSTQSTEDLRHALRETMKVNEARNEQAFAMFEQMSRSFKTVMEDARSDAARVSVKLMEFAQANFRNNVELARDYAAVRSVPDAFNVQAAYLKRQIELMNRQAAELRVLTTEIASKKAAQFQNQMERR